MKLNLNRATSKDIITTLKHVLFERTKDTLKEFTEIDMEDLDLENKKIDIKKEKFKERVCKNSCLSDIFIGGVSIATALLFKKIGKKTGSKIIEASGILAGCFIGSAAGSGIAEELFSKEEDVFIRENVDAAHVFKQIENIVYNTLDKILTKSREEIIARAKEIINKGGVTHG